MSPGSRATHAPADVRLVFSKPVFDRIQMQQVTLAEAVRTGDLRIEGQAGVADEFFDLLDTFPARFAIVTP
jgi:alkyl sulfatase BDS1-like metallo-beta-lactamase superfamily hydrolase